MSFQVTVEKLVYGGDSLARHDGVVVFVPGGAPGDVVQVKAVEKKKNFWIAKDYSIVQPGPDRRQPSCAVFGKCGGCQWQHVSYKTQLTAKEEIVKGQLRRVVSAEAKWHPIISAEEWHYRNRIQVHKRGPVIGFMQKGTDQIVPVSECGISDQRLIGNFSALQDLPDGRYELYLGATSSQVQVRSAKEENERTESAFSQVNQAVNDKMLEVAMSVLRQVKPTQFWDLYGGGGNFSFPMLAADPQLKAQLVELSPNLCQKVIDQRNQSPDLIPRLNVEQSSVENFLKSNIRQTDEVQFVVIDPPRPGLNGTITSLLNKGKSQHLLYISCNPSALARDLAQLDSYVAQEIWILDMFPQTYHVETMVWLQRR